MDRMIALLRELIACRPIVPLLEKQEQEDYEFKVNFSFIVCSEPA